MKNLCFAEEKRWNIRVEHNLVNWPNLVAVGKYNQIPAGSQAGAQVFLRMVHAFYF